MEGTSASSSPASSPCDPDANDGRVERRTPSLPDRPAASANFSREGREDVALETAETETTGATLPAASGR